jgi:hypothetical protein
LPSTFLISLAFTPPFFSADLMALTCPQYRLSANAQTVQSTDDPTLKRATPARHLLHSAIGFLFFGLLGNVDLEALQVFTLYQSRIHLVNASLIFHGKLIYFVDRFRHQAYDVPAIDGFHSLRISLSSVINSA